MIFYGKFENGVFVPSNKKEAEDYETENKGKSLVADIKRETGIRTPKQSDSLHLWCELVAEALNDSGQLLKIKIGGKEVEIDWTKELVKEAMWKPVQLAITGKKSTTQLDKLEPGKVFDHLNRFLAERCNGIHVPWPTVESKGEDEKPMPEYPTQDNQIKGF